MASRFASVPELVNRTSSIDGNRSQTAAARPASYSFGAPKQMPSASASRTAPRMIGCEWPYRPAVYSPRKSA